MNPRATSWIDVTVLRETDKAVLVSNGKDEAWLPKSWIVDSEDELGAGVATKIEVDQGRLEEKGLV